MSKIRFLKMIPVLLGLFFYSTICFAQNRNVSGIVTDQNGTPLTNATVTLKGTFYSIQHVF